MVSVTFAIFIVQDFCILQLQNSLGFDSIYTNLILLTVTNVIGTAVLLLPKLAKMDTKRLITINLVWIFIFGMIALAISLDPIELPLKNALGESIYTGIRVFLALGITIFDATLYCLVFQYIPTQFEERIRGVSTGFCVLIGDMLGSYSVQVASIANRLSVSGLGLSCIPSILSIILLKVIE